MPPITNILQLFENNFHLLEVVGRVSETQIKVFKNSNYVAWRLKG